MSDNHADRTAAAAFEFEKLLDEIAASHEWRPGAETEYPLIHRQADAEARHRLPVVVYLLAALAGCALMVGAVVVVAYALGTKW